MNKTFIEKASSTSVHREKFIIPRIEDKKFNSQHSNTCMIQTGSFKRNILMSSTKHKSWSHQKLSNRAGQSNQIENEFSRQNHIKTTSKTVKLSQPKSVSKFKVITIKTDNESNWLKWKKTSVDIVGKKFILSLGSKISKNPLPCEQKNKENSQIFNLKHNFRQLQQMRRTVKKAHENNQLIKKLKIQSNQKIIQFFGKYQKMVQQNIK